MSADRLDSPNIDLTLLVTCCNEQELIVPTLESLLAALAEFDFSWEVIIIDDGSKDESVQRIQQFLVAHRQSPIRLFVNETNQGFGYNIVEGAFLGCGEYYRVVCGDNAEPKETHMEIFKQLGKADLVMPCPFYDQRKTWFRNVISQFYTSLVNVISGHRLKYYNGLPLCRRYDVMRWHGNDRGFGFQADLVVRLLNEGRSVLEVDVYDFEQKSGGSTALNLNNLLSAAYTVLNLSMMRADGMLNSRKRPGGTSVTAPCNIPPRQGVQQNERVQNAESG